MYSNPTGYWNLSKPDCPYRKVSTYDSITYEGFKEKERADAIDEEE